LNAGLRENFLDGKDLTRFLVVKTTTETHVNRRTVYRFHKIFTQGEGDASCNAQVLHYAMHYAAVHRQANVKQAVALTFSALIKTGRSCKKTSFGNREKVTHVLFVICVLQSEFGSFDLARPSSNLPLNTWYLQVRSGLPSEG